MSSIEPSSVRQLYRGLLRSANLFPQYNFRNYALRRIKEKFREHKSATDVQEIEELVSEARKDLELINRQVAIGQMYPRETLVIQDDPNKMKAKHT